MMKDKLLSLQVIIDKVVEWTGIIFCFFAAVLCILVVFGVLMRMLGTPTIWNFEVCLMFFGAHFFLLGAYGLKHKAHAAIDIFTARASRKTNSILQLFCYIILFFPFAIGIFFMSVPFAMDSWLVFETSWSVWGQPLYIVKSIIPIGMFLLIIQGIAEVIKIIYSTNEEGIE